MKMEKLLRDEERDRKRGKKKGKEVKRTEQEDRVRWKGYLIHRQLLKHFEGND